jgi:hypothetical protein
MNISDKVKRGFLNAGITLVTILIFSGFMEKYNNHVGQ